MVFFSVNLNPVWPILSGSLQTCHRLVLPPSAFEGDNDLSSMNISTSLSRRLGGLTHPGAIESTLDEALCRDASDGKLVEAPRVSQANTTTSARMLSVQFHWNLNCLCLRSVDDRDNRVGCWRTGQAGQNVISRWRAVRTYFRNSGQRCRGYRPCIGSRP